MPIKVRKENYHVCAIKRIWMQGHDKVEDDLLREAHMGRRCMADLRHRSIVEVSMFSLVSCPLWVWAPVKT